MERVTRSAKTRKEQAMTIQEAIEHVLTSLPEERLHEVLEFAEFLTWRDHREAWRRFGQAQLAKAYGPDEPDYTEADLRREIAG